MPSVNVNMNVNLDVRKWTWPESLTFGKGASTADKTKSAKSIDESDGKTISQARDSSPERLALPQPVSEASIDTQSLAEALSTNSILQSPKAASLDHPTECPISQVPASHSSTQDEEPRSAQLSSENHSQAQHTTKTDFLSPPPFTETYLHFDTSESNRTRRRLVRYLTVCYRTSLYEPLRC